MTPPSSSTGPPLRSAKGDTFSVPLAHFWYSPQLRSSQMPSLAAGRSSRLSTASPLGPEAATKGLLGRTAQGSSLGCVPMISPWDVVSEAWGPTKLAGLRPPRLYIALGGEEVSNKLGL